MTRAGRHRKATVRWSIRMRHLRLPHLPACLLLLGLASPAASIEFTSPINFDLYPAASQPCLYQEAVASGCTGTFVPAVDVCLCRNGGGFVTNVATCLGQSDPADLARVYDTMYDTCSSSGTALSVPGATFFAAADAARSPSVSSPDSSQTSTPARASSTVPATLPTPTANAASTGSESTTSPTTTAAGQLTTPTPIALTSGPDDGDPGNITNGQALSGIARAGIITGSIVVGFSVIGAGAYSLTRYRRRKRGRESRMLLPPPPYQKLDSLGGTSGVGSGSGSGTSTDRYSAALPPLATLDLLGEPQSLVMHEERALGDDLGEGAIPAAPGFLRRPSRILTALATADGGSSAASTPKHRGRHWNRFSRLNWESPYDARWGENSRPGSQPTEHWVTGPSSRSGGSTVGVGPSSVFELEGSQLAGGAEADAEGGVLGSGLGPVEFEESPAYPRRAVGAGR